MRQCAPLTPPRFSGACRMRGGSTSTLGFLEGPVGGRGKGCLVSRANGASEEAARSPALF
eukprot:14944184-Alexandrium_andersonii.AAC.1